MIALSSSQNSVELAKPFLVVDVLARQLAARGVKHVFGVPGGDCSLDLISACANVGIDFILARTESAAGIMASVTGELTGTPGVLMVTRGPGLAHGMNGVAYAALDRAPLLVLADGYDPKMDHVAHQRYDQHAMIGPLAKGSCDLGGADPGNDIDALLDLACAEPPGPVYIEMRGGEIRREVRASSALGAPSTVSPKSAQPVALPEALKSLLAAAKRPVIIAGLQARTAEASTALRKLSKAWNCPVLETYKSLGTMTADEPLAVGCYTAGAADGPLLSQADLVLLYGLDAIEFPAHKWLYAGPIVEFTAHDFPRNIVKPDVSLTGPIAAAAEALTAAVGAAGPSGWPAATLAASRADLKQRARAADGEGPLTPQDLVDATIAAAPANARITLDAGAHMLPVLHAWHATEPRQSLISRGLATMAFALPAAIGSALAQPERPVIAFTGDGGLMMCAGELGTAVQYGCKLVVVVFNDSSLTLIEVKQRQRKFERDGLDFSPANFAKVAEGFGCLGLRVETLEQLAPAMRRAFAHDGPVVIDAVINPDAYSAQLAALRG